MDTFYGPAWDFRTHSLYYWQWHYFTNPFVDELERIELGRWINGQAPTYGEWYYQWAERNGIENVGSTIQPHTPEWNKPNTFQRILVVLVFLLGIVVFSQNYKR